jgi:hypothetical protein
VDAGLLGRLDGASCSFNIFLLATRERGDARAANFPGDHSDGVGVALAGDSKTGLENVNAKVRELVGHAQLFIVMHGAAGGLFAVAEGRVEEDDLIM